MPQSDALKIARLHHQEVMAITAKDTLLALEPLVTICASAGVLGWLENERWGERQYQLISTNQKRALLTGVVAIEVARSGLIGQVAEGVGAVGGVVKGLTQDVGGIITPLLAAI